MEWFTKTNRRRYTGPQLRTKSGRRPALQALFVLSQSILGHSLHEKGSQRQIDVGTLVSIQKRRALLVPQINRLSIAILFLHRFTKGFRLFVLQKGRSEQVVYGA